MKAAVLVLVLSLTLAWPAWAASGCIGSALGVDAANALVLSGGGAKGAWEAGVVSALIRGGFPIQLVAGSSAGALNAAMIADGRLDRLEELWRTVTREQIYALRPSVFFGGLLPGWLTLLVLDRAGSLFDARPLRELIGRSLDLDRVRDSPVRVVVTTTDLARRQQRLFDNQTLSIDALMAATAVPGAFPPVEVDGELLVDGGLTGRAPILTALEVGNRLDRVVVLVSYAAHEDGDPPTTLRRALEQSFEMTMVHQIRRETELARLRYPRVDVQLLVPSASLALRPLDFEPGGLARALELGRRDGAACLERWRADSPR
ncbi:MAG: patatin-like phospholipase family protein [Candidatus Rokuibacteriota bacterium]